MPAFRRPIMPIRPKVTMIVEYFNGPVPVFQVTAYVAVEPVCKTPGGRPSGAIKIVFPVIFKHIGVPYINFAGSHNGFLTVPGARLSTSSATKRI